MEKFVKNYRLPATDLANLLFRDQSVKRRKLLEFFEPKVIPYTYNPFRNTLGDAVNLQLEMLDVELQPTPWEALEGEVIKACKGDEANVRVNMPVARATHEHAKLHNISATQLDMGRLRLAPGRAYTFWMPVLLEAGGQFFVSYPEPRRKGHLTALGINVVLSAQHERLRAMGAEFAEIGLQVWRYKDCDERTIVVYPDCGMDLIPYAQLAAETADVYQILDQLIADREEAMKKSAYGRRGSLL